MSRARPSLPVFAQVALLVAVSIALAMSICFAVILHAPPPPQPGFTIDEAVSALEGETVRTAEGRALRRTVSDASPVPEAADEAPLARVISLTLQSRLELPAEAVRVRIPVVDGATRRQMHRELGGRWQTQGADAPVALGDLSRSGTIIIRRSRGASPDAPPPPPIPPQTTQPDARMQMLTEDIHGGPDGTMERQITVLTEQLRFPPFVASARLADGRWATVSPPSGVIWSPWHTRILLTFLACLALLLPLAWFMARRLARPIRLFAAAAERLGADPHAPPLDETGPAEVRDAAHAFNEMQTQLNRYVEGRTQMVAAIAHDLRTPLTRLRFRAEQADPEIRGRMAADIEQMNGMISQALAYVRGETVREERALIDLAALTASIAEDLAEIGAEVTLEAAESVVVLGEALNLRRAVSNLVENAVKFAGSARVAVFSEREVAVITVVDSGPGLPADQLETVFEPFQRGEKSRNRDTGGTGLGLAVARGVARAHGGAVTLSNRAGGGLEARLTLPIAGPD